MPAFFDPTTLGLSATNPYAPIPGAPSALQPLAYRSPAPAPPSASPNAVPIPIPRPRPPIFPILPDPSAAPQSPTNNAATSLPNPLATHGATLMALGAGLAQGGIGKGLAMASAAAENERTRQAQQLSYLQTYKALVDGGVPQDEALAATLNPSLMRTLATKYLGARSPANAVTKQPPAPSPSAAPPPASAGPPNTPPASIAPPIKGLRQASDGKWYLPDPGRSGKYLMVQ
jgi:hypothetical protein